MTDDLKKIWDKVDARFGPQRMETEAEHIARDIREGNFPKRSDPIQIPVNPPNEMTEALKPCPFCGGEAHIDGTTWRPSDGEEVAWVVCKVCNAYGPTFPVKEAIAAWNRRAYEEPQP